MSQGLQLSSEHRHIVVAPTLPSIMRIGLVGKPNVGKSTAFSALTATPVDIADYPFTTIDPNVGIAWIPTPESCRCKELAHRLGERIEEKEESRSGSICQPRTGSCYNHRRLVPVTLVDVAGLVPGAHEGRGRGNQFLSDLSRCDALIQVVDVSGTTDLEGNHTDEFPASPISEHNFLIDEIDLWLSGILKEGWSRGARRVQSGGDRALIDFVVQMISGLGGGERDAIFGIQAARSNGADNQPWNWDGNTLRIIASEIRKSMFPIAIAANKADRVEPDRLKTALDDLEKLNLRCIPTSAEAELTLSRASNAGLITYQPGDGPSGFSVNSESILSKPQEEALERIREKTSKLEGNGLIDLLSKVVFEDLSMIVAYPVADEGKWTDAEDRKLPDSIILQSGSTARDLAYAVHTDLGDGFIRATNCVTGRTVGGDTELLMSDVIRIHSRT